MKLYAPKYYKEFVCIADRCRHSCCIGWEIDIDSVSLGKYESLKDGYGRTVAESIDRTGTPHFRLSDGDRCPHLDSRGLCRMITELSEDDLCDICREHPRFYNDTPQGREAGLGLSCEEACRIILGSDDYNVIEEIAEVDGEEEYFEFDAPSHRRRIYAVLSDRSLGYVEKLRKLYKIHGVSPASISCEAWRELCESLEFLKDENRELLSVYSAYVQTPEELEKPLERALAYFVYRHCSSAANLEEFTAALGFALFCERLLCSMAKKHPSRNICDLARILSEELEYSEANTETIKFEFLF